VRRSLFLLAFTGAATVAGFASADGGYYSGNKGAHASGRAGAFAAKADDLSAVMYNPAGLARLDGHLIQVGNRFSYNAHEFTRAPTLNWGAVQNGVPPYVGFASVENDKPWQWLEPFAGFGSSFGLEDWGFALVAYAPPGVARQEFPVDGGQRYMMVSREAQILNYTLSAAYKFGDRFGIGASLQWIDVALLDYQLVIDASSYRSGSANSVSSSLDMLAQVRGADHFTPNAILGAWYRPTSFLELGLSGQVIPTEIKTHSTLSIFPLGEDVGDDVELRRDGERADDVRLTLPLPVSARAGIRYFQETDGQLLFDVELDVTYESWSRTERFTLDTNRLIAELLTQTLDVDLIEIEKEWRDTIGVHLGGDYAAVPDLLTVRGGLFYESAVADSAYAAVDFVSGRQFGGTLGASLLLGKFETAISYDYRRQPEIVVTEGNARVYQEVPGSPCEPPYTDPDVCHPQYLGQPSPAVNAGRYRAFHHAATLDLLYRF
jgi:long-chain fatty acid transport protein